MQPCGCAFNPQKHNIVVMLPCFARQKDSHFAQELDRAEDTMKGEVANRMVWKQLVFLPELFLSGTARITNVTRISSRVVGLFFTWNLFL